MFNHRCAVSLCWRSEERAKLHACEHVLFYDAMSTASRASRVQSLIDAARSPQRSPLSPLSNRLNQPRSARTCTSHDGKLRHESSPRRAVSGSVGACAAASQSPLWSPSATACTTDIASAVSHVPQHAQPLSICAAAAATSTHADEHCGTAPIAATRCMLPYPLAHNLTALLMVQTVT